MTRFIIDYSFVVALFFCTIVITGCQSEQSSTGIKGQLLHEARASRFLYIYTYPDSFSVLQTSKMLIDSCQVDQQGNYHWQPKAWKQAAFVDLATKDEVLYRDLFLKPGQTFQLDFDMKQTPAVLVNRSSLDPSNLFLQQFSDTFYRSPEVKDFYYTKSNFLLAPEYSQYIDARHARELAFAQHVTDDTTLPARFRCFVKSEIDYQWANDKIAFLWKKWIRNEEVKLDSNYYNFLKVLAVNNPESYWCPAYQRFLHLYIREMYRQLPLEQQDPSRAPYKKCELATQLTKGIATKLTLLHILTDERENAISLGVADSTKLKAVQALAAYIAKQTGDLNYLSIVEQKK